MSSERNALAVLDAGLEQLGHLVRSVRDEDLDRPTPCTDWSVSDLVDHIVRSTANLAVSARGGDADWGGATPHHEDAGAAFSSSAEALRSAWAQADDTSTIDWHLAELATHTWDLASALGRDTTDLDAEVAERGLAFMSAALKPEQRSPVFEQEQPAPPDADAYQRIAAFAGRAVG